MPALQFFELLELCMIHSLSNYSQIIISVIHSQASMVHSKLVLILGSPTPTSPVLSTK